MLSSVVQYRRDLHRIPEIEDRLPKTTAYVLSVLKPLNCTVTTPTPGSVCAYFNAGKEDTVAFRADMDALPLTECTDLPYASCHPGFFSPAATTPTRPWRWHWQSMCRHI